MLKNLSFVVVLGIQVLAVGCAATPAIQGKSSYVATGFDSGAIEIERLALLPIVAGAGVEGYRRPFGDAINASAGSLLPKASYLPWQETMQKLNEADLVEDYQQAISAYASTSIVPRRLIQSMSEATGTKYFMYVSLNSPMSSTTQKPSVWSGTSTETHIGVSATGQVWDVNGDVVWEGIGISEIKASSDNLQIVSAEERSLDLHSQRAADALLKAALGK